MRKQIKNIVKKWQTWQEKQREEARIAEETKKAKILARANAIFQHTTPDCLGQIQVTEARQSYDKVSFSWFKATCPVCDVTYNFDRQIFVTIDNSH